jgi:hypothetical protein
LLATHINPSQPYGALAWVAALAQPLMGQGLWPPTTKLDPFELMIYIVQLPPLVQSLVPVSLEIQAAVSSALLATGEPGIVRLEKPMTACPMQCSSRLSSWASYAHLRTYESKLSPAILHLF